MKDNRNEAYKYERFVNVNITLFDIRRVEQYLIALLRMYHKIS